MIDARWRRRRTWFRRRKRLRRFRLVAHDSSAFSVYRLAHCYELTDLQHIVITHLCSHLTPASAFPILLASFVFPELHAQVKAYCLAHYFEILSQPEFSVIDMGSQEWPKPHPGD
ncbi:hypothetical protein PtA15_18A441 [Puccinia triticina]|uniref:Uncharacterized protein n=1 Tax=Puccinia triticina TaxID=208348 RepID=A0ABY7DBG3_9BASI|nr:uncharacterized protein PtA15_18A441 [Puccinia triticina]WAQ93380.1 hypothetical protein PtA15_18A441 [Puccinia triticina]